MPNYVYFLISVVALIGGYAIYGTIVEKIFGARPERPVPARTRADGVDFVEMPAWKVWLIQLLNIAGVGPVFGPILGALWGPSALLWIVIGCIFAGAVHDYFAGMLSVRYDGANVPTIVGHNLGNTAKIVMQVFSVVLVVLVGVVFVAAPAGLLAKLTPDWMNMTFWICVIFAYYFLATILPIDQIIGRFYPLFGAVLIFMAVGITTMLFVSGTEFFPSMHWANQHPKQLPIYPLVFITIACGALSGFHATQSPLMARCLANERLGKPVFYGGMIAEGLIGLVWATVAMSFYHTPEALTGALAAGGPGNVVSEASFALMGSVGGVLAILGVVVLPITSGDTAFRAARLTIAEAFSFSQANHKNRLLIAVPIFAIGIVLANVDFNIIWRYFGWANQSLAGIVLWAGAAYLYRKSKFHWICTAPAMFITSVAISYICFEKNMGLGLPIDVSNIIGAAVAIVCLVALLLLGRRTIAGAPENV
ncbi:MAG: carbon starvation protein A [Desulfovibrio sp.]|jgi:carbon starvation protein CstA|nr:carbon starvation protein A [Desulfovibrio sp.]